ncbi:MAG TPA: hypothetical protein VIK22_13340 [Candidatus Anoxymicrobiaceae bacterium]
MKHRRRSRNKENEVGGLCCSYCADTKYPCVRMKMTQMAPQKDKPVEKTEVEQGKS